MTVINRFGPIAGAPSLSQSGAHDWALNIMNRALAGQPTAIAIGEPAPSLQLKSLGPLNGLNGIKDTQVPTLYQAQAPGTGDYYASLIGQHDTQWYFLGKPG